ncbi:hypothetical protein DLNHIDIE_03052 [Acidithiobacillus thiooxidans ATCC 19377]|uniref:Uncharacterized protein n=1 Tax=Acidithiobacillus thiooxidans ATCC 19377 TaxID=637390 RepID=A0A543PZZ1_ACITH|nr:hypothetical protein DLNHIDIE_03052 [Acidithiobacillus thiooxidans ATCC 19377]
MLIEQGFIFLDDHGIDLAKHLQTLRFASTRDNYRMHTSRIGYSIEARETIGQDLTYFIQRRARPVFYGKAGESPRCRQSYEEGIPLLIHWDGCDKGHLVFGTPSRLATGSFPAQLSVISLYGTQQRIECFAFQHGLHQLMMDTPGRGVAHAELVTQRQSRHPSFRLADQVTGKKPKGQTQTRSLKKRSGNQRSLVATVAAALKGLTRAAFQNRMASTVTLGAMKSFGPMRRFQGRCALFLSTKTLQKTGGRQAFLELHAVHRHWTLHCHKNQWNMSG